jgi:hypothetical protein
LTTIGRPLLTEGGTEDVHGAAGGVGRDMPWTSPVMAIDEWPRNS